MPTKVPPNIVHKGPAPKYQSPNAETSDNPNIAKHAMASILASSSELEFELTIGLADGLLIVVFSDMISTPENRLDKEANKAQQNKARAR